MDEIDEIIDDMFTEGENEDSGVGSEVGTSDDNDVTEFGSVPIHRDISGLKATILAIFVKVDISPLAFDIMMDDTASTRQTLVLFEIDNQTEKSVRYGNDAITYVSDSRLKINPTSGSTVVWEPAKMGSSWNHAPGPGHYTEVESGLKTRWASLVDVPDSSQLSMVILDSEDHSPISFKVSSENFADNSNLPYEN